MSELMNTCHSMKLCPLSPRKVNSSTLLAQNSDLHCE